MTYRGDLKEKALVFLQPPATRSASKTPRPVQPGSKESRGQRRAGGGVRGEDTEQQCKGDIAKVDLGDPPAVFFIQLASSY